MNRARRRLASLVLLGVLVPASGVLGQEPEESVVTEEEDRTEDQKQEEDKKTEEGRWYGELTSWVAQPVGLDYHPATRANPDDPLATVLLSVPHGTNDNQRVRGGYTLPGELGRVMLTYWSQRDPGRLEASDPSRFIFGETLAVPFFAGFRDDGRADGFRGLTLTKTRDLRLDYYRPAFVGKRIEASWFIGYRRVAHDRSIRADYFALVPDHPPLLPPLVPQERPDLVPRPDRVDLSSRFSGRGVGTGLDVYLPIGSKVKIETGASIAILRGKVESTYASQTHFYGLSGGAGVVSQIYDYPFDEFEDPSPEGTDQEDDPTPIAGTLQFVVPLGIRVGSQSASGWLFDAYLGARWRAWRTLDVFAGFRQSRYQNVGSEVRPKSVSVSPNGTLNLEDVSQTDRSVGYEGYYLGVGYRY